MVPIRKVCLREARPDSKLAQTATSHERDEAAVVLRPADIVSAWDVGRMPAVI
jgi:hypothetical protein